MILQGGMFWCFGLYHGIWRFASLPGLARILKAVTVGIEYGKFYSKLIARRSCHSRACGNPVF